MLSEIIIYGIVNVITYLSQWMPGAGDVPLKLPWGIDDIFVSGVTGYKILAHSFPPFTTVLTAFIIYISFRVILRLLKAVPFLGNTLD